MGVGRANVLVARFRGVGRTHGIDILQTRIRRKDGTGNSYLYWIWSSGTTFTAYCCFPGMSLQRVFVLWVFVCSVKLSLFSGYHAEGYHARTDTFKLTGYHVCRVSTPELPRSIQTSRYRRVITPAASFVYFPFIG